MAGKSTKYPGISIIFIETVQKRLRKMVRECTYNLALERFMLLTYVQNMEELHFVQINGIVPKQKNFTVVILIQCDRPVRDR